MGKVLEQNGEIIHRELSYQVMQAVFEVHNTLGPGFLESVYEEALACEFEICQIPFERQKEIAVYYKNRPVGSHRLDLLVDGKIVVELKAVACLNDGFKQQTLSYLKATGLLLGILINFGSNRVEYVRIAHTKGARTNT